MNRKYFSIEQANHSLVLVRPIVQDIVNKRNMMIDTKKKIKNLDTDNLVIQWITKENELKKELKELSTSITYNLEELEMIGCYLKDFKKGVIDFPSVLDRRVVFLSWQLGEKTVNNWHEVVHSYDKNKVIKSLT